MKDGFDSETFGTGTNEWRPANNGFSMPADNGYTPPSYNTALYNDYANTDNTYNMNGTVVSKGGSRALEICALVFGILGIVLCVCFGLFGLTGLIISIVCLAKGRKSGFSIAGLICSIVGIIMTIIVFAYSILSGITTSNIDNIIEDLNVTTEVATDTTEDNKLHSFNTGTTTEKDDTDISDDIDWSTYYDASYEDYMNLDEDYAKVIINDKEISLPCEFAEIKDLVTISDIGEDDLKDGIEPNGMVWIETETGDMFNCLELGLYNSTDQTLSEVDKSIVFYVADQDYDAMGEGTRNMIFMDGLGIGSTKEEVEAFLSKFDDATTSSSDDCTYYYIDINDMDNFSVYYSISVSEETKKVYRMELTMIAY